MAEESKIERRGLTDRALDGSGDQQPSWITPGRTDFPTASSTSQGKRCSSSSSAQVKSLAHAAVHPPAVTSTEVQRSGLRQCRESVPLNTCMKPFAAGRSRSQAVSSTAGARDALGSLLALGLGKTASSIARARSGFEERNASRETRSPAPLRPAPWRLEIKKWLDFNHLLHRILHGPVDGPQARYRHLSLIT